MREIKIFSILLLFYFSKIFYLLTYPTSDLNTVTRVFHQGTTLYSSLIIFWQRNGFLSLSITHIFIQTYVRNFTTLSTLHAFFPCWLRIRFLRPRRESERVEKEEYWVVRVSTTMIPSHVRQLSPNFPLIFWQRAMDHKLLWIFHNTCQKLYHSFNNTSLLFLTES